MLRLSVENNVATVNNSWTLHLGGVFVVFNFRQGPFQDKVVRTAAAHAIDRNAIHNSVFYRQGDMLDQVYPRGNPWHLEGSRSLEYDPEKAKTLLKQAKAVGTAIELICNANLAYNRESAQIVQEMWTSTGFKVTVKPLDAVPLIESVTCTVMLALPAAVGVPEITPVAAESVSPAGSVPAVIDHV